MQPNSPGISRKLRNMPGSPLAGLLTFSAMVILFLLTRNSRATYVLGWQYVNCLLLIPGIIYAISKRKRAPGGANYLDSFIAGVMSALYPAVCFAFFLVIFLNFIDPYYMRLVVKEGPLGKYMSPLILTAVFLTEQVCSGLIITLITLHTFSNRERRKMKRSEK